jgi:C-terminal processing protease CtpA/Prc
VPEFPPPESGAGAAAASAINELNDTSALIFDLRENHGGAPEMVALMCSYLFGPDPVHLNDMHWRNGENFEVQEFWTQPQQVDGKPYGEDKPIYVLTSHDTFSGGEEFTYDLQALGRATIVGETTGGGANPAQPFDLAEDFMIAIPNGTPVNPVTKTNWEGTGVKPDIEVPKEKALETAQDAALEKIN